MANELNISCSINLSKAPLSLSQQAQNLRFDVAGTHYHLAIQDVFDSDHNPIVIPADIATLGRAFFRHAGSGTDKNIQIGLDSIGDGSGSFMPCATLAPGEPMLMPLVDGTTYFAKAASGGDGTEPLLVLVIEA